MADFCLDCFNKLVHQGEPLKSSEVITNYDICDNCLKNLPCVIGILPKETDND